MTVYPKCGLICQTKKGREEQQKQRDIYYKEIKNKRRF
jgi:hypothetical protein